MSMFRDFGATNKPDTCLWCGRRLPVFLLDRQRLRSAPTLGTPSDPAIPEGFKKVRRRVRDLDGFNDDQTRRVVELDVVKLDARRGVHGDGMFCTRGCGEAFGRNAAGHLNLRLAPLSEKP